LVNEASVNAPVAHAPAANAIEAAAATRRMTSPISVLRDDSPHAPTMID